MICHATKLRRQRNQAKNVFRCKLTLTRTVALSALSCKSATELAGVQGLILRKKQHSSLLKYWEYPFAVPLWWNAQNLGSWHKSRGRGRIGTGPEAIPNDWLRCVDSFNCLVALLADISTSPIVYCSLTCPLPPILNNGHSHSPLLLVYSLPTMQTFPCKKLVHPLSH